MSKNPSFKYETGTTFDQFLLDLRSGKDAAWEDLTTHFRARAIPYLKNKVGYFSSGSVVSVDYFIEEVFADSLVKFYELFTSGQFENAGHLRGLMFRIIDNQLLAAYKKKKSDRLVTNSESLEKMEVEAAGAVERSLEQQSVIQHLETALKQLPDADRMILHHYSIGGKLIDIAEEMNISEANCRKKKQRAMEKLRSLLKPLLFFFAGIMHAIGI
ncbi:MAG: RNA polymerase sigma factor [Bacteroidota bacterium]